MNKVVINKCYGGFGLSPLAVKRYFELKYPEKKLFFYKEDYENNLYKRVDNIVGEESSFSHYALLKDLGKFVNMDNNEEEFNKNFIYIDDEIDRHDPILIQVVEELGDKANGDCAELCVVEIEGNLYRINEHDGFETIEVPETQYWIEI